MANFKTAEFVSPKHPDKICDQISDAILDAYLLQDPDARVAVDVAGGHGVVFVTGEVTSIAAVDVENIVQRLAGDVRTIVHIAAQSPEIAAGVDTGGAGDQGIMVGYATSETSELLPLEYVLARELNHALYKKWPYDGKTQVTLKNDVIHEVVASFQHASKRELAVQVRRWLDTHHAPKSVKLHINPAGDWEQGGFDADAGLTGRKLAVDNYGPRVPLGGGAFSGKDPSKVDRSGAYIARRIAVDYLRKFDAREVYVYLAYAIGYNQPVQATAIVDGKEILIEEYDLSPRGIIDFLNLKQPGYEKAAAFGHYGQGFAWDK